jgi:hypothetical protein
MLYGFRIPNVPFEYEYSENSLIVSIPNKLWFELNNQQDYLQKEPEDNIEIFSNDILEYTKSGYDIGPFYPTYTADIKNDSISKTDIINRKKNAIQIDRTIILETSEQYDNYVSKITFSEFGSYENNTFSQEGCNIKIQSQTGDIRYNKESSTILVTYPLKTTSATIKDTLNIAIECKGL